MGLPNHVLLDNPSINVQGYGLPTPLHQENTQPEGYVNDVSLLRHPRLLELFG